MLKDAVKSTETLYEYFISTCESENLQKAVPKAKYAKLMKKCEVELKSLENNKRDGIFGDILEICVSLLDEEGDDLNKENGNKKVIILRGIILLLRSSISMATTIAYTQNMIKLSVVLHGKLPDFSVSNTIIAEDICWFCVEAWQKNMPFKQDLWLNSFSHLLKSILSSTEMSVVKKINVLYELQPGLKSINFDSIDMFQELASSQLTSSQHQQEDAKDLLELLLMVFECSDFYSSRIGNKFLANTLLHGKTLIKAAHEMMLKILQPSCPSEQATALGEILHHAWKQADDEIKVLLEENCIQDLMYRAIHAPRSKATNLFKPYHAVLFSISLYKTSQQVRQMLCKLYAPIIWRALKANNGMVRANASRLFIDAFPMELVDVSHSEKLEFTEKQLQTMNSILRDECPQIRVIGILGVCEIMCQIWNSMPAHVIAIYTKTIFTKLAFDGASADVRQAVYTGTKKLLEHSETHPLLNKVLPEAVKFGIHDNSERVRLLVLDVLSALKHTYIKFWEICPLDDLLNQLENEQSQAVCKSITNLIKASFMPPDDSYEEWLKRCINFYKKNTVAAGKFYKMVVKQLTIDEMANFLEKVGVCIMKYVKWSIEDPNTSNLNNTENPNETTASQSQKPRGDSECLSSLLEVSCMLWKEYQRILIKDNVTDSVKAQTKKIAYIFCNTVHLCLRHVADERGIHAVIILAHFLQPEHLPLFSKGIASKLRSLPDSAPPSYYEALIKCVCKWKYTNQVLALIDEWLARPNDKNVNDGVTEKRSRKSKPKKTKKKGVRFTEEETVRPEQAIKYLHSLLAQQALDKFELLENKQSCDLLKKIAKSLYLVKNTVLNKQVEASKISVTKALETWFTIQIILHKSNPDDLDEIRDAINWFKTEVFEKMQKYSQNIQDINTSVLLNENSMSASEMVLAKSTLHELLDMFLKQCVNLLSCNVPLLNEIESFFLNLVSPDNSALLDHCEGVLGLINILNQKEMLQRNHLENDKEENNTITDVKPASFRGFNNVLCCMSSVAARDPDGYLQLFRTEIRSKLKIYIEDNFLTYIAEKQPCYYMDIVSNMLIACQESMVYYTKNDDFTSKDKVSDLPPYISTVIPLLLGNYQQCDIVYKRFCELCEREFADPDNQETNLSALANLMYTLMKDGKMKHILVPLNEELCQRNIEFRRLYNDMLSSPASSIVESNSEQNEEPPTQTKRKKIFLEQPEGADEDENIIVFENPQTHVIIEELHEYT